MRACRVQIVPQRGHPGRVTIWGVFELERISSEAVPGALEKAERYRLLNESLGAESICLDILPVDWGPHPWGWLPEQV